MCHVRLPITLALLWVSTTASFAEEIVFHRRDSHAGDVSNQTLHCDLNLTMSIRQGGQIVQQQKQVLQRQQQRELTILQASAKAPRQARVKYKSSTVTLHADQEPPQASEQPVTGKTYLVTRQGDKLSITYPDGAQPPEEEQLIVRQNMETFGLPNPIATFFDGKRIRVGQTMRLPKELARDLLGFTSTGNAVSQFGMKLAEVRPAPRGASPVAVLEITLKAEDPDDSGVSMTLTGRMMMEVQTCRTLSVKLSGPVVASEMHGPEAGQYELHSKGQIEVAVEASYLTR